MHVTAIWPVHVTDGHAARAQLEEAREALSAARREGLAAAEELADLAAQREARERAEREAEASRRQLELLESADDSYEAVLAQEMGAMREAFEAKLSEAQEALRLEKLERRREVHRLVTTHAEELRAAEARAALPAAIRALSNGTSTNT